MRDSTRIADILTRPDAAVVSAGQHPTRTRHRRRSLPSAADAFLFLRIFAFAVLVPYALRLKLPKVAAVLETGAAPNIVSPERLAKISAYVETAIRRGRPFVRSGCLTRGLTRYYFLRRAGMDIALLFGMGRRDAAFMGHCWLVKDGEPYLEPEDPRPLYAVMYRISRAGGVEVPTAPLGGLQRS
ncbi:MAG TPA: lasso peptide biosynthesis B2 protein [Candidatus Eremiobacteraceae bacterium]|nr:lasso peptide biosynthesis B2 protein [Candidatus Eremiobacteraceae bacterium]